MSTATVPRTGASPATLLSSLATHWPEYLMEAACLGAFMLSACAFSVFLGHPASPAAQSIDSEVVRRLLIGIAMGTTAICIVLSPWGQRSGAHMNPAITLTYLILGKMAWRDALFYIAAQFIGGIAGVLVAEQLLGLPLRHSAVNYAVTTPGPGGPASAFAAELLISGVMMAVILVFSNHRRLSQLTPYAAGLLVALYITVESPISGMSMNPARTLGSAIPANSYTALWIYFTAPVVAMFAAGVLYRIFNGANAVYCAKLNHHNNKRCIFRCDFDRL